MATLVATDIRVSSGTDCRNLAKSIVTCFDRGLQPYLRAIGAAAVNQAMKAVAIARTMVINRGLDLTVQPHWETTDADDIERAGNSGSDVISVLILKVSMM